MYQKVQNWPQFSQQKVSEMAQNKIDPIRKKALEAIQAVAKENGYGYVIDASTSVLLVSPAGDNLLKLVKAKLGIKDVPAAPSKSVVTPKTN
jgi:outer membrane protein